jgi:phosphate transport system ATP-binding protein
MTSASPLMPPSPDKDFADVTDRSEDDIADPANGSAAPQPDQARWQRWRRAGNARLPRPAPPGALPETRPFGAVRGALASLEARDITAWFGDHMVLERVSLTMEAGHVTALIGPSGCGKSTFLRILNRMHQLVPGAAMAGEVLLDGVDIYDASQRLTEARRHIGMVFQKPNPFPAMSIYDNVVAGLRLTGAKVGRSGKDDLVQECLTKAGLWREVHDRLRQPGGALSGGQQQRLCIARSLAIRPRVLLMDEPCSALDPTSTRVIEETMADLVKDVTIVIVTHNMQQAQRVSDQCAFFLAEQNQPGYIVEHGPTEAMFDDPQDPRTADYVNGRFG